MILIFLFIFLFSTGFTFGFFCNYLKQYVLDLAYNTTIIKEDITHLHIKFDRLLSSAKPSK